MGGQAQLSTPVKTNNRHALSVATVILVRREVVVILIHQQEEGVRVEIERSGVVHIPREVPYDKRKVCIRKTMPCYGVI